MLFKRLCNYDIQASWEGEGSIAVGEDTLGSIIREYLKAIVRNVTERHWWVRMILCTNNIMYLNLLAPEFFFNFSTPVYKM